MRTAVTASCVSLVLALSGASVGAQWPKQPTPGVPRTAAGAPDLNAPAPRMADGKPDLSGLWRGGGGGPAAARGAAPAAPPSGPPVAAFRSIGQNMKGGELPLTELGAKILKTRMAGNSKDNPEAHCLPMGIIQLHTQGAPRRYVHTPRALYVLYEASMERREIFIDGRTVPTNDPQPWWNGYSAGRWEGDTLVVETGGFRDDGWLDIIGSPLTDAGRVTERFRRPTFGRMEIDITIEDKKAYTSPFTVRVNQQLMVDEDLIEFVCLENQRFGPEPGAPKR
jgi:hypothetical protein